MIASSQAHSVRVDEDRVETEDRGLGELEDGVDVADPGGVGVLLAAEQSECAGGIGENPERRGAA